MKTLEEIKNEFARELSYNSWSEFRMINNRNIVYIEGAMDEVAKRYAKEVAIASLEKASESAKVNCNHEEIQKEFTDIDSGYLYFVDKSSITNEENIVLK